MSRWYGSYGTKVKLEWNLARYMQDSHATDCTLSTALHSPTLGKTNVKISSFCFLCYSAHRAESTTFPGIPRWAQTTISATRLPRAAFPAPVGQGQLRL